MKRYLALICSISFALPLVASEGYVKVLEISEHLSTYDRTQLVTLLSQPQFPASWDGTPSVVKKCLQKLC